MTVYARPAGLKCWAYCPPGGLVNPNLSRILAGFCCGIVVDKDVVPRLSIRNLNRLLDEMIVALARCRLQSLRYSALNPKAKIC